MTVLRVIRFSFVSDRVHDQRVTSKTIRIKELFVEMVARRVYIAMESKGLLRQYPPWTSQKAVRTVI